MRPIKYLIYLLFLLATLLLGWTQWQKLITAVLAEAAYFPDFPFWPLWLPLGLLLAVYLLVFGLGLALNWEMRLKHHVAVLLLFGVTMVVRLAGVMESPSEVEWRDEQDNPPDILMAQAAGRLKTGLDQKKQESGSYPTQSGEVEDILRVHGKLPLSGFRSHGIRAAIQIALIPGAEGPQLSLRPGDHGGTLYYAVKEDGSDYWITLVGLASLPAGPASLLCGTEGEPIVISSQMDGSTDERDEE